MKQVRKYIAKVTEQHLFLDGRLAPGIHWQSNKIYVFLS